METAQHKPCAHPQCGCQVEADQQYCSDECRLQQPPPGASDVAACACGHSDCIVKEAIERVEQRS